MSEHSAIEWTDATWPIVQGCDYESPGCTHCYAVSVVHRLAHNPNPKISAPLAGLIEKRKGKLFWTGKVALREDRLDWPLTWREPKMIFVPSHGDIFHPDVPDAFLDRIFAVMALAPQHTFQVLTKRPERMRDYLNTPHRHDKIAAAWNWSHHDKRGADNRNAGLWPFPNIWLGVSVEDQARADERIPLLLDTPAAVRFLSCEPLLGPVDLTRWLPDCHECGASCGWRSGALDYPAQEKCNHCGETTKSADIDEFCPKCGHQDFSGVCPQCGGDVVQSHPDTPCLDWVIVGGESGDRARPMHPYWARSLRDQCAAAGVPFFFKQWGAWTAVYDRDRDDPDWRRCDTVACRTPDGRWLNLDGGHGFHGERVVRVYRVGKKAAGRLLDGRTWDQFPEVRSDSVLIMGAAR